VPEIKELNAVVGRLLPFCQASELCMENASKTLALCAARRHIVAVR
jgi:hypothetical protein